MLRMGTRPIQVPTVGGASTRKRCLILGSLGVVLGTGVATVVIWLLVREEVQMVPDNSAMLQEVHSKSATTSWNAWTTCAAHLAGNWSPLGKFPTSNQARISPCREFFGMVTEEVVFRVRFWKPTKAMSWERFSWAVKLRDSSSSDGTKSSLRLQIRGQGFEQTFNTDAERAISLSDLLVGVEDMMKEETAPDMQCLVDRNCEPNDSEMPMRRANRYITTRYNKHFLPWLLKFAEANNWKEGDLDKIEESSKPATDSDESEIV